MPSERIEGLAEALKRIEGGEPPLLPLRSPSGNDVRLVLDGMLTKVTIRRRLSVERRRAGGGLDDPPQTS